MKTLFKLIICITLSFSFIGCEKDPTIDPNCSENVGGLKLNQYQIIGSHNSYRLKTTPEIFTFVHFAADTLSEEFDPSTWDYEHESLYDQLSLYGIRSIELDVFRDPDGGLFYNRIGNSFVGLPVASNVPQLLEPGLKILHFPDLDYNTTFYTFKAAITELQSWSNANPNHLAITVLIEAKEDNPDGLLPGQGLTSTLPFTENSVEEIENEIDAVFQNDKAHILKPDDVRNGASSLRDAVTNNTWPSLDESRGKIAFVLMARDEVVADYVEGHSSLINRNMFVFTSSEKDEAAYLNINNPSENLNEIQDFIDQGFMVRTQADSNTYEARSGDYTRMNNALSSGAQIICTDYYRADPRAENSNYWTDYEVRFTNNQIAIMNQNVTNTEVLDCLITE